jgi:hypothetical protein
MCPSGFVTVQGVRYSARSSEGVIESGEPVLVVKGDNSGLVVVRAGLLEDVSKVPRYGDPVYASFGEAVAAKGERQAEVQKRWEAARRRWLRRTGPAMGLLHGLFVAWWCQELLTGLWGADQLWLSLAALGAGGALLGYPFLAFVDNSLRGLDESLHRASLVSAGMSLVLGTLMFREAAAQFGIAWAVFMGAATAILAAIPFPLLLVLAGAEAGDGELGGEGSGE